MPGGPNHCKQERDDPEIEEFEDDDRRHDHENRPIARVELGGVEQRQKLVGCLTGHFLPLMARSAPLLSDIPRNPGCRRQ
jgi:hypothetical protein